MKAIIPVAGAGTKLRPITYTQPKPLIPVAGKPIIAFILDELIRAGVHEFVFVIGYLGEKIKTYLDANYQHIEKGPYKFIRHPAYAGNILQAVGVPLILNAYLTLSISAMLVLLFLYRLKREEEVLVREVKGYEDYTKRTYRLIPKIW